MRFALAILLSLLASLLLVVAAPVPRMSQLCSFVAFVLCSCFLKTRSVFYCPSRPSYSPTHPDCSMFSTISNQLILSSSSQSHINPNRDGSKRRRCQSASMRREYNEAILYCLEEDLGRKAVILTGLGAAQRDEEPWRVL